MTVTATETKEDADLETNSHKENTSKEVTHVNDLGGEGRKDDILIQREARLIVPMTQVVLASRAPGQTAGPTGESPAALLCLWPLQRNLLIKRLFTAQLNAPEVRGCAPRHGPSVSAGSDLAALTTNARVTEVGKS